MTEERFFASAGGLRMGDDAAEGEIEISAEQYAAGLDGVMSGKLIVIDSGFAVVDPPEPEVPEEPDPVLTEREVIAERERRLSLGFDYDFGDERGVHHIGTTAGDMRKWLDEVTPIAQALINSGEPGGEIGIATDTGQTIVTAAEWQSVLVAAGLWRQPIYQASFALQAMDPIPADFADDARWS